MKIETDQRQALLQAAEAARYAPSVHNTQPWNWILSGNTLELHADSGRQLTAQDPDAHMLLLSCGAALHHAEVALAADGWQFSVDRPAGTPLAVIHLRQQGPVDPLSVRRFEQLPERHTDRRAVGDEPVVPGVLDLLVEVAEQNGTRLDVLRQEHMIELAVVVEHALKAQSADEDLQRETVAWVGGDRTSGTGIPDASLPQELPLTTVAERDFGARGTLAAGAGHDTTATYAILYGEGDEPADWIRAGEALNAVWLAAAEHDVTLLPLSSATEVPFAREELRRLIGHVGFPYLVLRFGTKAADAGPARTPRMPIDQIIDIRD
ncbi:Acg family FMN-binding oxidoreductase [Actinoplanes solisilvae]|uniref:Acg family FMN-binding oxidoreductase n=1 Tax=Actinoplanes solisilvae TaxID=2486853 RepID=UPI000FD9E1FD|nr:nitroreductase [Actinoplanes solisilvae]